MLAGLGAAASLAAYYLTGEHSLGHRDPLSLAAWTFTAAAVFWSVLQPPWAFDGRRSANPCRLPGPFDGADVPLGALVAWIIVLGTVVPYGFVLLAIRNLGSTRTGLLGMAEPVTSGIVAWVVLSESLTPAQLVGAASSSRASRRRRRPARPRGDGVETPSSRACPRDGSAAAEVGGVVP